MHPNTAIMWPSRFGNIMSKGLKLRGATAVIYEKNVFNPRRKKYVLITKMRFVSLLFIISYFMWID